MNSGISLLLKKKKIKACSYGCTCVLCKGNQQCCKYTKIPTLDVGNTDELYLLFVICIYCMFSICYEKKIKVIFP